MTSISRYPANSGTIRQSVIEAVRQLERAQDEGSRPQDGPNPFQLLADALPVALVICVHGDIAYANAAANSLFGAEEGEDLKGEPAAMLAHPAEARFLVEMFARHTEGSTETGEARFQMIGADGAPFAAKVRLSSMVWNGERATAAVIDAVDEAEQAKVPTVGTSASALDELVETNSARDDAEPEPPPEAEECIQAAHADLDAGPRFKEINSAIADHLLGISLVNGQAPIIVDLPSEGVSWDARAAVEDLRDQTPEEAPGEERDKARDVVATEAPAEPEPIPPEWREAQRLSEAALAASTDGIVITDALQQGHPIIYVNAAFERITGYGHEEVVGRSPGFLWGDDVDQSGLEPILRAVREGVPASSRLRVFHKDGSSFSSEFRIAPVRDGQGRVTHFVGIHTDVSNLAAAEERLAAAEGRLQAFTDTAAEWFWEFDADLNYAFASDKYFEITGDLPADILGKTIYEFQKGVITTDLDALFTTLEAAKPFLNHVFSRTRPDGSVVWFSTDGRPVVDDDGAFVGYRGSAREITAEIAARQAMRESEERLWQLTAQLPAMAFQRVQEVDGAISIPFASDLARELYGLDPTAITANPELLVLHIHPDDREEVERRFRRSADTLQPAWADCRIRDAAGREKWVLTLARPRREDGRRVIWDCIALDITERKRASLQLQSSRDSYRALVSNDTRMISCFDADGACTFVNAQFADFLRRPANDFLRAKAEDFLPADAARRVTEATARAQATGERTEHEITLSSHHAGQRVFRMSANPVRTETGAISQMQITWLDITEVRDAETAREETERRMRLVMDAVPAAVSYIGGDRRCRAGNRRHEELFGATDEPTVTKPLREIVGEAAYEKMRAHVDAALSGEPVRFEWKWEEGDRPRHFDATLAPHVSEDGDVHGFFLAATDVTEVKDAQEAARESQERLENLAANVPGLVYRRVVDWRGNAEVTYLGGSVREITGVDENELAANPALTTGLIHPDDQPRVRDAVEAARLEMKTYDIEHRLMARSGDTVWFRNLARPHMRERDNAVVWDGLMIDITERKRAEEALTESEQRYRGLAELSPDAIIVHDAAQILFANPAAASMHNVGAPLELVGRPWDAFVAIHERETAAERTARLLEDGKPVPFSEGRRLRAGGGDFAAETSAARVPWQGRMAVLNIYRDLTERQAADAALRESEDRLRALAYNSPDSVYVAVQSRIVFANDATAQLFGVGDRADLIGANPANLDPPMVATNPIVGKEDSAVTWAKRQRTLADGEIAHYAVVEIAIEWKEAPAMLVVAREMTAQKRMERELEAAKADAEQASTTAIAAMEVANTAREAKSRFLATMSREIRTPLNGVLGMTGLLIDSGLGEDQRQHAETIRRSSKALLGVVNDILDYASLVNGGADLEAVDFEFRPSIESVIEVVAPSAFGKGIDVGVYVAPNVPVWVNGDPGRLRHALFNIMSDAVQHTDQGAVTLKINLAESEAGRLKLYIRIAHSGPGMPEKAAARMFDDFLPAEAAGGRPKGDARLGLAISAELVRLMGGEIGLEPGPDIGNTFWFTVELKRAERTGDFKGAGRVRALAGRRALLIGGNSMTRRLLQKQLTSFGMAASAAITGEDALDALTQAEAQRTAFDLAIVDLAVPDMEATELARVIRERPVSPEFKLVLSAPTGRTISPDEARLLGFDAALKKPIQQDDLIRRVPALYGANSDAAWKRDPGPEALAIEGKSLRILVAEANRADQQITSATLTKAGHRVDLAASGIEAVSAARTLSYDVVLLNVRISEVDAATAARLIRELPGETRDMPIIGVAAGLPEEDRERLLRAGLEDIIAKPVDAAELAAAMARRANGVREPAPPAPRPEPNSLVTDEDRRDLKNLLESLGDIVRPMD